MPIKPNNKPTLIIVSVFFIMLISNQIKAHYCNKSIVMVSSAIGMVLIAVIYNVLWNPYKSVPSSNEFGSITLKNFYGDAVI